MPSLLLLFAAACHAAVTQPDQIKVAPGFKVELLREAGPREGSWICMAQDDKGRLYISPQNAIPESGFAKDSKWGGIWRVTLKTETTKGAKEEKRGGNTSGAQPETIRNSLTGVQLGEILNLKSQILNWEKVPVPVGDAMGMLWAFDSLYVSGQGPQGRGIYRCQSSHGDDQLDTATLFKAIPGGAGEHGAHAIVLGPDRKLYIMHGNSTGILDGLAPDSPYRNWGEDDLLPRLRDPVATFFDKIKAPYGCVYRTDADGTKWELFAGGFRNPYDIAFNADGELFTYDSDMEWDRGLPWYRPTRLLHIVPGGEYGFREGSAKWPAYFPDSLPAAGDIGLGCPTGMKFGTEARKWPWKYTRALFLLDWTFGRILVTTPIAHGASYRSAGNDLVNYTFPKDAEANGVEVFVSGKGLPVTDMEFGKDGAMYFITGGRGTASGLYRVSVEKEPFGLPGIMGSGPRSSVPANMREIRRKQEDGLKLTRQEESIWTDALSEHRDPFALFTAQSRGSVVFPPTNFEIRKKHRDPGSHEILLDVLAKIRAGSIEQTKALETLNAWSLDKLGFQYEKLLKLRALELSFARQGRPSAEAVQALVKELLAIYPVPPIPLKAATAMRNPAAGAPVDDPAWRLNRELSQLLIWLTNPELGELNSELAAKAARAPWSAPGSDSATPLSEGKRSGAEQAPTGDKPPTTAPASKSGVALSLATALQGPVPNPGAAIFSSRRPAPFQTELGREVIGKTLALMDAAPSQEEQIAYALALRWAHGWSPEQRVRYFRWFHEKAARYTGGNSFAKFVEAIRADAASRVPEPERAALSQWLRPVAAPTPAAALKPRAFVKAWTLPELETALDKLEDRQPDLARGLDLYTQAQCAQCHLFRDAGGNVGPDLTAVAQRFGRHDILESITDPSKVVSDQYAMVTLTVLDGQGGTREVSGLVKEETSATITLLTDPLAGKTANLYKNVVVKTEKAAVSTMPPGLLNTLTAEEVADLLALFGAK